MPFLQKQIWNCAQLIFRTNKKSWAIAINYGTYTFPVVFILFLRKQIEKKERKNRKNFFKSRLINFIAFIVFQGPIRSLHKYYN